MSPVLLKSDQVGSLVEQATEVVMKAVVSGRAPNFPDVSWAEIDYYFRYNYLPKKLSPEGLTTLQPFLTLSDNWHSIRDLIPTLTDPWDQRMVINALAYLASWQKFNQPLPGTHPPPLVLM